MAPTLDNEPLLFVPADSSRWSDGGSRLSPDPEFEDLSREALAEDSTINAATSIAPFRKNSKVDAVAGNYRMLEAEPTAAQTTSYSPQPTDQSHEPRHVVRTFHSSQPYEAEGLPSTPTRPYVRTSQAGLANNKRKSSWDDAVERLLQSEDESENPVLTTTDYQLKRNHRPSQGMSTWPELNLTPDSDHGSRHLEVDHGSRLEFLDDDGLIYSPIEPINDVDHEGYISRRERGSYEQNVDGDVGVHPRPRGPPPLEVEWGRGLAGSIPYGHADHERYVAPSKTTAGLVGAWTSAKKRKFKNKTRVKFDYRNSANANYEAGDDSEQDDSGEADDQFVTATPNSTVYQAERDTPLSNDSTAPAELGGYVPTYAQFSQHNRHGKRARALQSPEDESDSGDEFGIEGRRTNEGTNAGLRGFSRPSMDLLPSRDSGHVMHHSGTNLPPKLYPTETVSDAHLAKRGLTRAAGPMIPKRAHGVNDPDNIFIVNTYENKGWSWGQIADNLNKKAMDQGRRPKFTANAVQNRYNRNAPLLFASEGKKFVPVRKRSEEDKEKVVYAPVWTADLDNALVQAVQKIDSARWGSIVAEFNALTGEHINEKAAATRHMYI